MKHPRARFISRTGRADSATPNIRLALTSFSLWVLCGVLATAQLAPVPEVLKPAALRDDELVVAELKTTIRAEQSNMGQSIQLLVVWPAWIVPEQRGETQPERVLIPSGAKLTGIVTRAVPRNRENPESQLSIRVTRVEWDGRSLEIRAFIGGEIYAPVVHYCCPHAGGGSSPNVPYARGSSVGGGYAEVVRGAGGTSSPNSSSFTRYEPIKDIKVGVPNDPDIVTVASSTRKTIKLKSGTQLILRQQKPTSGGD